MDYLLAVQAPAYAINQERCAIESAFAIHLKMLIDRLSPQFDRLILFAPQMTPETYGELKDHLMELNSNDDRIVFMPIHEAGLSTAGFWTNALSMWRRFRSVVREVGFVHSGLSSDTWRPYLAILNLAAWRERKPSLFVIDIDFRELSRRYFKLGIWSRKSYVFNRVFHDPIKLLQVRLAIRKCDLVLLKSTSMVSALARDRSNVKFFLDAAHGDGDVISDEQLALRLGRFDDPDRDLQVIYFGRLVPYKGCDIILDAVAIARARDARLKLTFVGAGSCLASLKARAQTLGIEDSVSFLPPTPYGPALFDIVDRADIAIAAPRVEDTPRAALDAMARGLPTVAFDIDYFKTLAETSGAVTLAEWPSSERLAQRLCHLSENQKEVADMGRRAVPFARINSQDIWLKRRIEWTLEAIGRRQ